MGQRGFSRWNRVMDRRAGTDHLAALGLSSLVLFCGAFFDVEGGSLVLGRMTIPPVCWLGRMLPDGCPGCGLTRSVVAFCHLEWRSSLALHPAGWLLTLIALIQFPYRLACLSSGKGEGRLRWVGRTGRFALHVVLTLATVDWLRRVAF